MAIEWDKINNECPVFSLEGQYIVKNLIIISAALVVGSTVRK